MPTVEVQVVVRPLTPDADQSFDIETFKALLAAVRALPFVGKVFLDEDDPPISLGPPELILSVEIVADENELRDCKSQLLAAVGQCAECRIDD